MFFPVVVMRPYKPDDTKIKVSRDILMNQALSAIRFVRKARIKEIKRYVNEKMKWYNWWRVFGIRKLTFKEVKNKLDNNDSLMNCIEYKIGVKKIYDEKMEAAISILNQTKYSKEESILVLARKFKLL